MAPSSHYGVELPRYDLCRCPRCGYEAAFPPPDPDVLLRLYDSRFFSTSQQHVPVRPDGRLAPGSAYWPVCRNADKRAAQVRRLRPSGRLLDVGCGKGLFVRAASRHYEAEGIDVSPDAVAWGRRLGLRVTCGDFLEADFGGKRFDVITFWDVLACTHEPLKTLSRAGDLLGPEGLLVVTVPDVRSLASRLLGRYWPLMIPPVNVGFYSRRSMDLLGRRCGFRPTRWRHDGKWVSVSFLALKLKRTLGLGGAAPSRETSAPPRCVYLNTMDIATAVLVKA